MHTLFDTQLTKLALDLFKARAIKDYRFSKDGYGFEMRVHQDNPTMLRSPIYLNLRPQTFPNTRNGVLNQKIIQEIIACVRKLVIILDLDFDFIAGIPNGGTLYAVGLGEAFGVPMLTISKNEKRSYFTIIEPTKPDGSANRVLLIDDVATHNENKLQLIDMLRDAGFTVHDLVVIIDREQGGRFTLQSRNVSTHSLFTLQKLLEILYTIGRIEQNIFETIISYLAIEKLTRNSQV